MSLITAKMHFFIVAAALLATSALAAPGYQSQSYSYLTAPSTGNIYTGAPMPYAPSTVNSYTGLSLPYGPGPTGTSIMSSASHHDCF